MSVAVNLTWMEPGRVGGSEEYLTRQLRGVGEVDPAIDLTVYVHPDFTASHPDLANRYRTVALPMTAGGRASRIVAEHTWLARRTRHDDVVHHGGGTVPATGGRKVLLTVHDLQYRHFPQYFSTARRTYLDAMMPRSARRADLIATPTQVVADDVADAFGIDPERIVVVPHGVPAIAPPSPATLEAAQHRFQIGARPYVIYPAITHPHKGHLTLVEMAERLPDTTVVLLGGEGTAEQAVRAAIEASPARDRIVRTGRVSAADRDALLAGAEALVFPSEFEGFGAPLIEAMALDVPVVSSSAPAVREVVGSAGITVDTSSGEAWAAAVVAARQRRRELVELGRARRKRYTLRASGVALADAYARAAA